MNRYDLNNLIDIYNQTLLEEDAESNIRSAIKMLTYGKFSQQKKQPFNRTVPDSKQKIELTPSVQSDVNDTIEELKRIVDESRPSVQARGYGKKYEFLKDLAYFYLKGATLDELKQDYQKYVSFTNKNATQSRNARDISTLEWNKFSPKVHELESIENLALILKNGGSKDNNSLPNDAKVYSDENITVYRATTDNFFKSVDNSRKLCKQHHLCIAYEDNTAFSHYARYRYLNEYALTTYFIYFNKKEDILPPDFKSENSDDDSENSDDNVSGINKLGYVVLDVVDLDRRDDGVKYSSNPVDVNIDTDARDFNDIFKTKHIHNRDKLMSYLEAPFKQGIFQALPLTEREESVKNTIQNSKSVFDESIIDDDTNGKAAEKITAYFAYHGGFSANGGEASLKDYQKIENVKNLDIKNLLDKSFIVGGYSISKELFDHLPKGKRNSYISNRLIKLKQALKITLLDKKEG